LQTPEMAPNAPSLYEMARRSLPMRTSLTVPAANAAAGPGSAQPTDGPVARSSVMPYLPWIYGDSAPRYGRAAGADSLGARFASAHDRHHQHGHAHAVPQPL